MNSKIKSLAGIYSLILLAVLSIKTIVDYFHHKKVTEELEALYPTVDFLGFNGWRIVFFFVMFILLEKVLKRSLLKRGIQIYMTLIVIIVFIKNLINIDDFGAGVEIAVTFTGLAAGLAILIVLTYRNISKLIGRVKR